ncbi:hypothetical protein CEXT_803381 [Caerostris extrusa]|uniref:Uncharacterized protein n=1 Tax=Caerostris extrusa TaxID=172846 RepID=A0AAV4QW82_CAEEX|nr:hypothetical protein CEXT_803381 [Caerostris extrusa]
MAHKNPHHFRQSTSHVKLSSSNTNFPKISLPPLHGFFENRSADIKSPLSWAGRGTPRTPCLNSFSKYTRLYLLLEHQRLLGKYRLFDF